MSSFPPLHAGIKDADKSELHRIASEPTAEHVLYVDDFHLLPSVAPKLSRRLCFAASEPPRPVKQTARGASGHCRDPASHLLQPAPCRSQRCQPRGGDGLPQPLCCLVLGVSLVSVLRGLSGSFEILAAASNKWSSNGLWQRFCPWGAFTMNSGSQEELNSLQEILRVAEEIFKDI